MFIVVEEPLNEPTGEEDTGGIKRLVKAGVSGSGYELTQY